MKIKTQCTKVWVKLKQNLGEKKCVGSKAYITKTFSLKNTSQINNTIFLHKRIK